MAMSVASSWEPLDNYDNGLRMENIPRKLSPEEIETILSYVPVPIAADRESASVVHADIVAWMRGVLKKSELDPSAIPELISTIIKYHNESIIAPGTTVGNNAAEAVGSTSTQMTLNTFQSSGSAKSAGAGIEALSNIIFARKTPKNASTTIYFKNKTLTHEEAINTRRFLTAVMASNFIKDYEIAPPNELSRYWWHEVADSTMGEVVPIVNRVLRLHLNTIEMYKYKISIKQLAEILKREVPRAVSPVYGPIGDAIIDLYPHPSIIEDTLSKAKLKNIPADLLELTYLETIVVPGLKQIRVSGINEIGEVYPVKIKVMDAILLDRKLEDEDITDEIQSALSDYQNIRMLIYNTKLMKDKGILPENVAALCELANLQIVAGTPTFLLVSADNNKYQYDDTRERKIAEIIDLEVGDAKAEVAEATKIKISQIQTEAKLLPENERSAYLEQVVDVPRPKILDAVEYLIVETDGANLTDVLALPVVDTTRTICNNMYIVCQTLGIEATYKFIFRTLREIITDAGSYVHHAHISLIAEFITSRGAPFGATYTGISRQPGGHLSLATVEKAGEVFANNALFGRREDAKNVSAAIVVGTRVAIGSGAFHIGEEITENGETKVYMNEDLYTAWEKDDAEKEKIASRPAPTYVNLDNDLEALGNLAVDFVQGDDLLDSDIATLNLETGTGLTDDAVQSSDTMVFGAITGIKAKVTANTPTVDDEAVQVPIVSSGLLEEIVEPQINTSSFPIDLLRLLENTGLPVTNIPVLESLKTLNVAEYTGVQL